MNKLLNLRVNYFKVKNIQNNLNLKQKIKRNEFNLLINVNKDIMKIKRLSIIWIPFIGYPIVMLAALRPKSFWPSILWTNKDFIKFTYDDINEQIQTKNTLENFQNYPHIGVIKPRIESIAKSLESIRYGCEIFNDNDLSLNSLPPLHIKMISVSLCLCSLPIINTFLSTSYLIQLIDKYITDLLLDDSLLLEELKEYPLFSNLDDMELVTACLNRGLLDNNTLTDSDFEQFEAPIKNHASDADIDVKKELILAAGRWNRDGLVTKLHNWILLTDTIKKLEVRNINSLVSHLIILRYRPKE